MYKVCLLLNPIPVLDGFSLQGFFTIQAEKGQVSVRLGRALEAPRKGCDLRWVLPRSLPCRMGQGWVGKALKARSELAL